MEEDIARADTCLSDLTTTPTSSSTTSTSTFTSNAYKMSLTVPLVENEVKVQTEEAMLEDEKEEEEEAVLEEEDLAMAATAAARKSARAEGLLEHGVGLPMAFHDMT